MLKYTTRKQRQTCQMRIKLQILSCTQEQISQEKSRLAQCVEYFSSLLLIKFLKKNEMANY